MTCFVTNWTFQQESTKAHIHAKLQEWCVKHFPCFSYKDLWSQNSPDWNPFDYSIWDELVQQVNWDAVTSKTRLISELNHAARKVSSDVVRLGLIDCLKAKEVI